MDSVPLQSVRDAIADCLEKKRDLICREIGDHPRPIPGCDVHFNRLLEDRTKIYQELSRWKTLREDCFASEDQIELIRAFVACSECIDEETKRKLGSSLGKQLAG
ncbi:MAG TPA: hypothetical protein VF871_01060 [Burkholderiales bacterium]